MPILQALGERVTMSDVVKKHAVVIGAGPAGLTAAHELLSRDGGGWDVTVLEASDAIGGISRTVVHHGNRMDIGGHRFFSKDQRVTRWWLDRMPLQGAPSFDDKVLGRESVLEEGGPDPEKTDRVMLTRKRVSRIYYNKRFFDYPISLKPATLKAMGLVDTVSVGWDYLRTKFRPLPEDNLENFYVNRFGHRLYAMFFEGYTEKLWGRHPRNISASWGAQRVKGLSITAVLRDAVTKAVGRKDAAHTETSLIEQFMYPKLGPGQLWEEVAHEVEGLGGTVVMGAEVTGVSVSDGGVVTGVTCADGRSYPCDALFSSMPLADLVPAMSDATDDASDIATGLPYRDFVTVGLLVPKLALKNETDIRTLANIIPDNWIYVQDGSVRLGRIQVFNNWSCYLVADPIDTVWVGLEYFCAEGDDFWNMEEDSKVALAVRELVSMGVLDAGTLVLDSHVERVKKAYPAYFDSYDRIGELQEWLDTHPNLFCIGRNGQHRYNNMDHSMCTAFEAIDCLLAGSTDRSAVWNVNTETEYHEERSE